MTKKLILPKQGFYVAFEGMDGSGKSTTATTTHNYFLKNYDNVFSLMTREPSLSDSEGVEIRKILADKDGFSQGVRLTDLFAKNRENKMNNIVIPQTSQGQLVFTDRTYASTFVYQGMQGVSYEYIIEAHKNVLKYPDLVLLFELPVEVAAQRINHRNGAKEFFDEIDILAPMHERYSSLVSKLEELDFPKGHDVVYRSINATKSPGVVSNQCIEVIIEELSKKVSKE